jgi:predicted amidohydrolase
MKHSEQLQVGAAQINCVLGDMERNLRSHREYIAAAHDKHLDLLVFPELSLTGYSLGNRVIDVACSAGDARLQELAEAAGTMQVVVGFVEEVSPGECYYALAILQDGRIQAVHR